MKIRLTILFISVIAIGILAKCGCNSCLAGGESFDLPYNANQTIAFINDSLNKKEFQVQTYQHFPPDEYCGHVGSESYGKCYGESSATIKSENDSSALIMINFRTNSGSDNVEQHINKIIVVAKSTLSIYNGVASTSDKNGVVKLVENITINGIQYKDVYVYQNDSVTINSCSYFVYGLKEGILKYIIKRDSSSENWTLVK